jgi:hypothetical protein
MKSNRGKQTLLRGCWLILLAVTLYADRGFTYHFTLENTTPYRQEAVLLTLDINQTDASRVMFFEFSPPRSDAYVLYRLDAVEKNVYQKAQIRYTYLLYPLKSGTLKLPFEITQKSTTPENVAYSFSGDRDNVKGITTTNRTFLLAPLTLEVREVPAQTDLVGQFVLDCTRFDETNQTYQAYEPISLQITLSGHGYLPALGDLIPPSNTYTLFSDAPQITTIHTKKGTQNRLRATFALSGSQDFSTPKRTLHAFDPKRQRSYVLTIPALTFHIIPPDPAALIDTVDTPEPLISDLSWIGAALIPLFAYMAGFLTARLWHWPTHKQTQTQSDNWIKRIKSAQTPRELLAVLLSANHVSYSAEIAALESAIYDKKSVSLRQIKKRLLIQSPQERP